jgi:hypothetical protein
MEDNNEQALANLEELANAVDNGEIYRDGGQVQTPEVTEPAPETEVKEVSETEKSEVTEKQPEKDSGTKEAEGKPAEVSPQEDLRKELEDLRSKFEKSEKEAQRLGRKLGEQQQKAKEVKREVARDDLGHSADDYEKYAAQCDANGDTDMAARARNAAGKLKAKTEENNLKAQQDEFMSDWNRTMNEVLEKNSDLKLRDINSDDAKAMQEMLSEHQAFLRHPEGFKSAVEFLKAKRSATLVPELQSELTKLKAEVKRLNGLTAIDGSGPNKRISQKAPKDMSAEEGLDYLTRLAAEHDDAGIPLG